MTNLKDTSKINISGTVNGFTIQKSVPSNAIFTDTNTWRPVVNNLTSTAIDQSLSAAQGKELKSQIDGKANSSHGTHVSDSGWQNISLASGITLYNTDADSRARCRKINNVVYVEMTVKGVSHGGGGAAAIVKHIATLPSGYRPSRYTSVLGVSGATQPNMCRFECNVDGTIKFRSAVEAITTNYKLELHFCFVI